MTDREKAAFIKGIMFADLLVYDAVAIARLCANASVALGFYTGSNNSGDKVFEALPEPERGGSLEELRSFFNVDHHGWTLIRAFLVAALRPGVPCPSWSSKESRVQENRLHAA